jgi:hypothetical protein
VRLARYGKDRWRARSLRGKEQKAQLALGERLLASGGGNPKVRQQLTAIDQTIQAAQAGKQPTKALKAQREQLLLQLAASALSMPAIPRGAETELKQVQDTRAALRQQDEQLKSERAALKPPDRATWLRVGVGYAVFGVAIVMAAGAFRSGGGGKGPLGPDGQPIDPQALAKLDTSLKLIPADAAVYHSNLRLREQAEAVRQSNFWKKLTAMPEVQKAWNRFTSDPTSPWAMYQKFKSDTQNQPLVDLLDDAWGQEVFLYGGDHCAEWGHIGKDLTQGVIAHFFQSDAPAMGAVGARKQSPLADVLKKIGDRKEPLRIPDVVIGFRLSKPQEATAGLKRLEAWLKQQSDSSSDLAKRLSWKPVAGSDFLVLELNGAAIDWDKTFSPLAATGKLDNLAQKLRELKGTMCLGVRDNFLILGVGETTAVVEKLGKGTPLHERAELQPLAGFAKKKLTEISYYSQAFRGETAFGKKEVERWTTQLKGSLDRLPPFFPRSFKAQLLKDIDEQMKELQDAIPEAGATMSVSFLTERGQETYDYDWTPDPSADASQPLTILNHVGGDPLFAVAWRANSGRRTENYQRLTRWAKVMHGHIQKSVLPGFPFPPVRDGYKKLAEQLANVDKVTREQLLPGLKDGQTALVLDGKLTSKQWLNEQPPADKPVPLPEIAVVATVSDAAAVRKAGGEYLDAVNSVLSSISEVGGPMVSILPEPEKSSINGGEMFYYTVPAIAADKRLQPNAAISSSLLALSLSKEHSERLLATTKPSDEFLRTDKPLAAAMTINWPALVDTGFAWAEAGAQARGAPPEEVKTAREFATLLKVFRGYHSITYVEDRPNGQAFVTRSETLFQDVP